MNSHRPLGPRHCRGRIPGDKAEVVEIIALYWQVTAVYWQVTAVRCSSTLGDSGQ